MLLPFTKHLIFIEMFCIGDKLFISEGFPSLPEGIWSLYIGNSPRQLRRVICCKNFLLFILSLGEKKIVGRIDGRKMFYRLS